VRKKRTALAVTLAAALIAGAAGVANAADTQPSVDELVARALPSAPATSSAAQPSGQSVSLDHEAAVASVADRSGTAISVTADDIADSVVRRTTDGGAQVLTVLRNGERTARFRLGLPRDAVLTSLNAGFTISSADGRTTYASIDAPWAVDAVGKRLPTSYRLVGRSLVQSVDTRQAVFPVVADPKISFGWGVYARFSRAEVRSIASTVGYVKFASFLCAGLPGPLGLACSGGLWKYYGAIENTFKSAAASWRCVELRFATPQILTGWKSVSC
jgi:hypothetical protein